MIDRPESDQTTPEGVGAESESTDPAPAEATAAEAAEETPDAAGAKPDTKEQAAAMRELLTSRRAAEQARGDASRLREEAASEAERMVSQAQELATQLVDEARTEADLMAQAARTHAGALTAGAEEEAIRLRKEVTEEVAATRLRAEAAQRVQLEEGQRLIREAVQEAASSVGDLRARLSSALESISAVESRLTELTDAAGIDNPATASAARSSRQVVVPPPAGHPARSQQPSLSDEAVSPVAPARSGPVVIETKPSRGGSKLSGARPRAASTEEVTDAEAEIGISETAEGRPLGWLFRASQR